MPGKGHLQQEVGICGAEGRACGGGAPQTVCTHPSHREVGTVALGGKSFILTGAFCMLRSQGILILNK